MSSIHSARTPACTAAEASLARIVAGEANAREREEFSAHLAACPRCTNTLSGVLALAHDVRGALANAATRFREAPPLALPPQANGRAARHPGLRTLTDFVLLLVLGFGLFLLIAIAFVSYRTTAHTYAALRVFRALNASIVLTHLCERDHAREPHLPFDARVARVRLDAVRILGPDALVDPWGTPYIIAIDGTRAAAHSAGPDRKDDGGAGDDITPRSTSSALGGRRRMP